MLMYITAATIVITTTATAITTPLLFLLACHLMILSSLSGVFYMGLGFLGDEDFTKDITELFSQLHVSSKPEKLARVSYRFLVIFIILLVRM